MRISHTFAQKKNHSYKGHREWEKYFVGNGIKAFQLQHQRMHAAATLEDLAEQQDANFRKQNRNSLKMLQL
jgi:hypothetical protein